MAEIGTKNWYVVRAVSGQESKIKDHIAKTRSEGILQETAEGVASGVIGIAEGLAETGASLYDFAADTDYAQEVTDFGKELRKNTGLGLAIGTLWIYDKDNQSTGFGNGITRNQLTFIQKGEIIGYVAKRNIAECDYACEREERPQTITIKTDSEEFKVGVLLCNDLPGNWWDGGDNCARKLREQNVDLIFFASNSAKDQGEHIKPMYDNLHNAMLRMAAFGTNCPIISVDNPINIDGSANHQGTSFTSGIHLPLESLYKAPDKGTKYFYFDTKDNSFGEN